MKDRIVEILINSLNEKMQGRTLRYWIETDGSDAILDFINQEVEKRIAERMLSEEDVMIYFDRNSNCVAKSPIKIPAMTRSAVSIMAEWFRNRMKGER